MPSRAPSVCPYCTRAHLRSEPCEQVKRIQAERKARADARRPSARQRGYDADWQRARADYLAAYPSCRRCGQPATLVDHIVTIRKAPHRRLDRTNFQSLCTHCHSSAKQRAERKD